MPSTFTIAPEARVATLNDKKAGQAKFTISNVSGKAVRGKASVVSKDPKAASWLSLAGEAEQDFAIGGSKDYSVNFAAPAETVLASYPVQLRVADAANDADFTLSPTVAFQEPGSKPPLPFPIWVIPVALLALLIIGGILFFVLNGLGGGGNVTPTPTAVAILPPTSTSPPLAPTSTLGPNTTATLAAQGTAAVIATAHELATASSLDTATAMAQGTGTAIANAQATGTAMAAAKTAEFLAQFNGCWTNVLTGPPFLTIFQISSMAISNQDRSIIVEAHYFNGLVGKGASPFNGPPTVVEIATNDGKSHALSMTHSGNQLTVNDNISNFNSILTPRTCFIVFPGGILQNPDIFRLATPVR